MIVSVRMADDLAERRRQAIARLDAELMAAADTGTAASTTNVQAPGAARKIAWAPAGLLAGAMFGGAVAGPPGVAYFAALGAISGSYRAYTGRSLLQNFSESSLQLHGFEKFSGGSLPPMVTVPIPSSRGCATSCAPVSSKPPC